MNNFNINNITTTGGTQPRTGLNVERVEQYAEIFREGIVMPTVKLMYDGENYWLYDGFHRVAAAKKAGKNVIDVEVLQGTQSDAVWASLAANKEHDNSGLYRTNADKRRAVEKALQMKSELSDREIAQHCGVSSITVGRHRKSIYNNVTDRNLHNEENFTDRTERTVTRGGTTYTLNTSNIGKSRQSKPEEEISNDQERAEEDREIFERACGFLAGWPDEVSHEEKKLVAQAYNDAHDLKRPVKIEIPPNAKEMPVWLADSPDYVSPAERKLIAIRQERIKTMDENEVQVKDNEYYQAIELIRAKRQKREQAKKLGHAQQPPPQAKQKAVEKGSNLVGGKRCPRCGYPLN